MTLKIPKYDDAGSDCSPAGKIFVQSQSENDKYDNELFAFLDNKTVFFPLSVKTLNFIPKIFLLGMLQMV